MDVFLKWWIQWYQELRIHYKGMEETLAFSGKGTLSSADLAHYDIEETIKPK